MPEVDKSFYRKEVIFLLNERDLGTTSAGVRPNYGYINVVVEGTPTKVRIPLPWEQVFYREDYRDSLITLRRATDFASYQNNKPESK